MNPWVSPEADRELTEGAVYYAREAGAELGLAFIAEFERALALICDQPRIGAQWRNRRRLPMHRFPYSLIYYTEGDELRVIALAHHRRKPEYWADRE